MTDAAAPKLPHSLFTTDWVDERDRWAVWRDSISVIFDASPLKDAPPEPFHAAIEAWHLDALVFGDTSFSTQGFDRSRRKVARDGVDHYLVQLYLDGGYEGVAGSGDVQLKGGDISILDLGQTLTTEAPTSHTYSLVVPRDALEAVLPSASDLHGTVLRGTSGLGMMLGDQFTGLRRRLPDLDQSEGPQMADALVGLIGACFRPTLESLGRARAQIATATLDLIKRHIEQNLASSELTPDSLLATFRLSRTSLYRLFEPLGGVTAYIQERRMARAYALIVHPAQRHRAIHDIAFSLGFTNEAHFSRAFRRAYGLAPSEARAQAAARATTADRPGAAGPDGGEDYADWIERMARRA